MTDMENKDLELESFFKAARNDIPAPPAALMARVLADAQQAQAANRPDQQMTPEHRPQTGLWGQFLSAIGGWPALGGLVSAGVVGLWIGINPPANISQMASSVLNGGSELALMDLTADLSFDINGLEEG